MFLTRTSPLSPQDHHCQAIAHQTNQTNQRQEDSIQDKFCNEGLIFFTMTLSLALFT